MNEKSVYIIKPEGMAYLNNIHEMITQSGLTITDSTFLIFPEWLARKLYPNLEEDLHTIMLEHMVGKTCEIGIVVGENAIEKLFNLCGTSTDPNMCTEGTIRKKYASGEPHWTGKRYYWQNVIHRPATKEEAEQNIEIISSLLPQIKPKTLV